tara:strand:- start:38 stop:310 length:273 start_codon:yes stop_codon:yes gene_type:complete
MQMSTKLLPASAFVLAGYAAYNILKPVNNTKTVLNQEQIKTRSIRSHLSGNHPSVSGGDDCLSRKYALAADSSLGEKDRRKYCGGTVTHF